MTAEANVSSSGVYRAELEAAQWWFSSVDNSCLITITGGISFRAESSGMRSPMFSNQTFHHAVLTPAELLLFGTSYL